jgi:hypothetical protein
MGSRFAALQLDEAARAGSDVSSATQSWSLDMRNIALAALAFLAAMIFSGAARAHDWSAQECREVADFLKNAALSRDYGMSANEFLGRMRSDIELVRAFPADLRWIVADAQDETLLLEAASQVFYLPVGPERHQSEFLGGCLQRFAHR